MKDYRNYIMPIILTLMIIFTSNIAEASFDEDMAEFYYQVEASETINMAIGPVTCGILAINSKGDLKVALQGAGMISLDYINKYVHKRTAKLKADDKERLARFSARKATKLLKNSQRSLDYCNRVVQEIEIVEGQLK